MEFKQSGLWSLVLILRGSARGAALSADLLRNPAARWRADRPVGKGDRYIGSAKSAAAPRFHGADSRSDTCILRKTHISIPGASSRSARTFHWCRQPL